MTRTATHETVRSIDRALRGDRSALEELVRAESPRLHGIAWRIVGDASLAEDVVQEVFVRLLQKRSPLRRKGAARAWLARVTAHAAIDLVRRNTARARREELHAMPGAEQHREARDAIADAEVHALVAEGFAALPADVRAAIWLTVVEGDPVRRAAKAIGLPVTTTHRRVREGLEALRKHLVRRGATAMIALSIGSILRAMPAPPPPTGLASRVLARIPDGLTGAGNTSAPSWAPEEGDLLMAALSAKQKVGINIAVGLVLLLGVTAVVVDPFHFRDAGSDETAAEPLAESAPETENDAEVSPPAAEPSPEESLAVRLHGTVLVRAVYEDDRSPVPGVLARGFSDGEGRLVTLTTDTDGSARFEEVPSGEFRVYLQMGSRTFAARTVDVQPAAESEVTLELPPGLAIDGVVVDGDGAPVAGASIWLTERHNAFLGRSVATAGEDGTFRLEHVEQKRLIGARAPGFAPSMLRTIEGRPSSTLPIRIVLDAPAADVRGVVLGPDGTPLPHAMVKIEKPARALLWTPDGVELRYPPLSTRTDDEGGFAIDGVPVDELTIAARWEDLVPFEEPFEVLAEGLLDVRIVLEEGSVVTGTVLTPEGKPASGTLVAVGRGESTDPYRSGDLASIATTVGQDGTYRLVGVPPGEVEVRADRRGKGEASSRLIARAGEEVRWDARLSLGREIIGRVVDDLGRPVEKVLVGAEGEGCVHSRIWTDADGRFRFSGCTDVPHDVAAYRGELRVRAAHESVVPGSGELTLVIRSGSEPSAFVSGRVVDPDGAPASTARIVMTGLSTNYTQEDGSFRIGPLPPGRHRLDVLLGEHPLVRRSFDLAPNATTKLGTIQVLPGGRVEARLRRPDGTPYLCAVRILNDAAELDVPSTCSPDGIVTSDLAQPGDYFLVVWRPGVAATCTTFALEGGRTTSIEVTIHDGVQRALRLFAPEEPKHPARVVIRTERGARVFDLPLLPDSGWTSSPDGAGFHRELRIFFASGTSYAAEVHLGERSANAAFFVSDLTTAADPVALDLR